MFTLFAIALSLPLAALAGSHDLRLRHRNVASQFERRAPNTTYQLVESHEGSDFFNGWDFWNYGDPTHGQVEYVDQGTASANNLAYIDAQGGAIMAVDSKSVLPPGANRKSIRISSQSTYSRGLFIADIAHMPYGCSVWPAWWLVGPNWPNGGEIDIVEGVNNQDTNQYTVHTGPGCTLTSPSGSFTGTMYTTSCPSGPSGNTGCGFGDKSAQSYGAGFNAGSGGVFATLIDSTGVKIWRFATGAVPSDIQSRKPLPATWGTPTAFWTKDGCDPAENFHDLQMVFDITLCGDWAGAAYGGSGCPGTCASAVADPSNFKYAYWRINSVTVYQ